MPKPVQNPAAVAAWKKIKIAMPKMLARARKLPFPESTERLHRAMNAHNRMLADYVLRHKMGIIKIQTIRAVQAAIENPGKPLSGNEIMKDLLPVLQKKLTIKEHSLRADARIDQSEAARRAAVCKILGKSDGEFFWLAFSMAWKGKS